MLLSDRKVQTAKPGSKRYSMSDGDGLSLVVYPAGGKYWRFRFTIGDDRREMSFGTYPEVPLAEARSKRMAARSSVAAGDDPNQEIAKPDTFGEVAREYMERQIAGGLAAQTISKNERFLFTHASAIKDTPLADVKPADILAIIKGLEEADKVHTAHRVRAKISEVYRYAMTTLRAESDPTYALRGAVRSETRHHRAAITDPKLFGAMMNKIDAMSGWPSIRIGLQLLALSYPRPIELRYARWEHIDLARASWHLPASITKMRRDHDIALSTQAVGLFSELRALDLDDKLAFPQLNGSGKPISENAMNLALKRLGIDGQMHCPHGFRASASTFLNKQGFDERVIETSLAHLDGNQVRRTYNRYRYWDERVKLAQAYADYIDQLKRIAARDDTDLI